jgi:hypothetical protein
MLSNREDVGSSQEYRVTSCSLSLYDFYRGTKCHVTIYTVYLEVMVLGKVIFGLTTLVGLVLFYSLALNIKVYFTTGCIRPEKFMNTVCDPHLLD